MAAYDAMNNYQKFSVYHKARKQARNKLYRQSRKTGIGILGQPLKELSEDSKYSQEYKVDSEKAGEALACATLTAEIMICRLAKVPLKGYLGRGQYPRFKRSPITPTNDANIKVPHVTCPRLLYFSLASSHVDDFINGVPNGLVELLQTASDFAPAKHAEELARAIAQLMIDPLAATALSKVIDACKFYYARQVSLDSSSSWLTHVREQLAKGGGSIYKYISSEEKSFLLSLIHI